MHGIGFNSAEKQVVSVIYVILTRCFRLKAFRFNERLLQINTNRIHCQIQICKNTHLYAYNDVASNQCISTENLFKTNIHIHMFRLTLVISIVFCQFQRNEHSNHTWRAESAELCQHVSWCLRQIAHTFRAALHAADSQRIFMPHIHTVCFWHFVITIRKSVITWTSSMVGKVCIMLEIPFAFECQRFNAGRVDLQRTTSMTSYIALYEHILHSCACNRLPKMGTMLGCWISKPVRAD